MKRLSTLFRLLVLTSWLPALAQTQPSTLLRQQIEQARQTTKTEVLPLFSSSTLGNYNPNHFKPNAQPTNLRIDKTVLAQIANERPDLLEFSIPTDKETLVLELVPVEIFAPTSKLLLGTATGIIEAPLNRGVFYQGFVKNKTNSLVSISIIDGEMSGFVADDTGNKSLSHLKNSPTSYLFYPDNTIAKEHTFICDTDESNAKPQPQDVVTAASISCKVVNIYFEADNQMYLDNGSNTTTTTNFILNVFNQVATIYNREDIGIRIAGIKIWTVADPYVNTTTTSDAIGAFQNYQNANPPAGISSQLSHLLSTRNLGGGIAYLDVLCSASYKYGVSAGLSTTYSDFPTYSWEVIVISHELGHNFGSPHTHSCTWAGGAIDNCYTTEGGCASGPAPVNGGTVMSYCHLKRAGINIANGFGPLPGNLIRNRVAACASIPTAADVPIRLAVKDIRATSAKVYWVSNSGSAAFTVQYRPISTNTWTTVGPFFGP